MYIRASHSRRIDEVAEENGYNSQLRESVKCQYNQNESNMGKLAGE